MSQKARFVPNVERLGSRCLPGGLGSLVGGLATVQTDALSQPINLGQIGVNPAGPISVGISSLNLTGPTNTTVNIGILQLPTTNTAVGLNAAVTQATVGLKTDAIEADLGGAGLEA